MFKKKYSLSSLFGKSRRRRTFRKRKNLYKKNIRNTRHRQNKKKMRGG